MKSFFASSALLFVLYSAATTAFVQKNQAFFARRSSSSLSIATSSSDGERRRHKAEFLDLEPLETTSRRKERMERDSKAQAQFARYGDDLWELREGISQLSEELVNALHEGERGPTEESLRENLQIAEQRDPEIVYKMELENAIEAKREGRMEDAAKHHETAMQARSCLPQFNLEGLWVGKYGNHGYEMINVTYHGDLLVAYKVTGDKNVPIGEITFQADLSPLQKLPPLDPIVLTDKAAKKWNTRQLPRNHGMGQVAEEGFRNNQWMDGQLIMIGEEYFSFAWVPIEHQIFFGRPSPELALKMLRDGGGADLKDKTWESPPSVEDDVSVLKDYAAHCMERTSEAIDEELKGDAFGCIWHGMDAEECYFQ